MFTDILVSPIVEALVFISSLTTLQFIKTFWGFLFIDLPRYLSDDIGFILYTIFNGKRKKQMEDQFASELLERKPVVTIMISALNEGHRILNTIKSLQEQTYPNIELIIVDDGSTDNTKDLCKPLHKKGEIIFIRNYLRGGKASALNLAYSYSSGEYIVIADADTSYDRDAILNLVKQFHNPEVGAVSGNILPRNYDKSLITAMQAIEYLTSVSLSRRFTSWAGILPIASGAFSAFRRDVYKQVGGCNVGPCEDLDISLAVKNLGYKVGFAPDSIALTDVPDTMVSFIKQRLKWERNIFKIVLRKYPNNFNFSWSNFSIYNLFSSLDIIFYQGLVTVGFFIYLIYLSIVYIDSLFIILFAVYLFYLVFDYIQLLISWSFTRRKKEHLSLFLYAPLFSLHMGYFYKLIRMIAYIDELFFRTSFKDTAIPEKVSRATKKW